ncbi:MAG: HD domain-containing phosphohydrolase [Betaproteobacteria bacterium]
MWRQVLPHAGSLYVGTAVVSGMLVLAASVRAMIAAPPDLRWVALAVLTVISGQLMLRMPAIPVSFSISDVFTFTAALMFGPAAGAVVVAIDAAVVSMRLVRSTRTATRYLFNVSAGALAMSLAARAFFALSPVGPLAADGSAIIQCVGPLAVFAGVYFALNTGLVALAVSLERHQPPWRVWREHFLSLWPGYFGGASAAGLALFLVSARSGDIRVLAFVLPIPFILYVTFRTAVARMQDHVGHLTRVNSMYLATIETLAQAVDARDQVTHDHIRRVQKNAMRLAAELGVDDELQLRALEAAALLHDTGKLAIPEHILNKPDKLTPTEFETMKLHATIGADILSPIGFPFPVVPIVRHHHENWDGTGYPDGLRGEQIPIGARIISVVDCFDALTSDRPYRRALAPERALDVIVERSGVMYDPAVVAALVRIKDALAEPSMPSVGQRLVETIVQASQAIKDDSRPADPAITAMTVNLAGRLGQAVGRHQDLQPLCDDICEELSLVTPGLTIVVYEYDAELDALYGRAASGAHRDAVVGLTIGVGLRLTGWVAAHRKTIVNSEAALDLGNVAATLRPAPQLCLSTPIAAGRQLLGVLTVYSTGARPFAAKDVALLEMLAGLLAPVVSADASNQASASSVTHPRLALETRRMYLASVPRSAL